jgi:hypothetical protein
MREPLIFGKRILSIGKGMGGHPVEPVIFIPKVCVRIGVRKTLQKLLNNRQSAKIRK